MTREQTELMEWLSANYEGLLLATAFRTVGDIETAKDVVQEAFWTACLRIDVLSKHNNPAGWMVVTVYNLAKCELGRAYHGEVHIDDIASIADTSGLDLPMKDYLPRGLKNAERKILLLRIDNELSFEQIAEKLGIRTDACRQRFLRALSHCRELMQENAEEESKV